MSNTPTTQPTQPARASGPKLATRRPTGVPSVPIFLIHGAPKSGRTVATIKASLSPWVDRMFVAQVSTSAYDDYGAMFPDIELLDHNGSVSSVLSQVEAACAVKPADGKLNVIVVDDASEHWATHRVLAETRQRRNKRTQEQLKLDPDAAIDPTPDKWNDVNSQWDRLFWLMKRAGVVGIFVCRGDDVMKLDDNGRPVEGQTVYRIEARKTTMAQATAAIRVWPDHEARLEQVTSLRLNVPGPSRDNPRGGIVLNDENPIGHAMELIRADADGWHDGAKYVGGEGNTVSIGAAKKWLVDEIKRMAPKAASDDAEVAQLASALWLSIWRGREQPGRELTKAEGDYLVETGRIKIADTLLGPVDRAALQQLAATAPITEPDDPFTEPDDPTRVQSSNDRTCPVCGRARHTGPCPR